MKRRRHQNAFIQQTGDSNQSPSITGPGGQGSFENRGVATTFQRGRKPNARDGHSACVDKFGFMFLFGGDRH
jgi:hypothetical protein